MIDPLFLAELNERLFTSYVGGRWIAPLGQRMLPVLPIGEGRIACIACAEAGDLARARAGLRGEPVAAAALSAAYAADAPVLRALRAAEGIEDPVAEPESLTLPGPGPLMLLTAAELPLARLMGLLIAGVPQGVIWKPAPRAAASAHRLMRALAPLTGQGLALVQGDHATGALLAGQGALVWASQGPVPPELAPWLRP